MEEPDGQAAKENPTGIRFTGVASYARVAAAAAGCDNRHPSGTLSVGKKAIHFCVVYRLLDYILLLFLFSPHLLLHPMTTTGHYQSTRSEYVPLIVEVCTSIVEDKGLDIIGIYRCVCME